MKQNENTKILIVVSGGVVQEVYSSKNDTIIDILDFDNEEYLNDQQAEEVYEERKKELVRVD